MRARGTPKHCMTTIGLKTMRNSRSVPHATLSFKKTTCSRPQENILQPKPQKQTKSDTRGLWPCTSFSLALACSRPKSSHAPFIVMPAFCNSWDLSGKQLPESLGQGEFFSAPALAYASPFSPFPSPFLPYSYSGDLFIFIYTCAHAHNAGKLHMGTSYVLLMCC